MKYVSRISGGSSPRFGILIRRDEVVIYVVSDGVESVWNKQDECIGIALDYDVAVKYTESEVELFKYIKQIVSVRSSDDSCDFSRSVSSLLDDPDDEVCLVSCEGEIFSVSGYKNSVIRVYNVESLYQDYMTVFEWLSYICKQVGCYLFDKRYLYIEGSLNKRIVVEFEQSPEAQRFLTKLYLRSAGTSV